MGSLDESQEKKLQQFQEITRVDDVAVAVGTLASLDWDVQKAIEIHMASPMDTDDGDVDSSSNIKHADEHNENGYNEFSDLFTTGSTSDEREDMDVAGSSTRRKGTKKNLSGRPNGLKRTNLGSTRSSGPSSSLSTGPRTRSQTVASARANSDISNLDMSSDDDHDDLDYQEFMGDDLDEPSSRVNSDDVPLVPTDFSSVSEAISNFNTVFESRYSGSHPSFYVGELRQAVREAFDAPNRPVAERKPLVVYLHHDRSVACHIFPKDVLCDSSVSTLIGRQFILWAWDVTQRENKQKFMEWIEQLGVRDVRQTVERTQIDRFPLLLIFVKDKGVIQTFDVAYGVESSQIVIEKLVNGLDSYQQIKNADAVLERERLEREQIRQEQAREYEKSLAADRARVERLEKERQSQEAEEKARLHAETMKKKKEAKLAASLPEEPPANEDNIAFVRIRFPRNPDNGKQTVELRRFRMTEPLRNLATFIESKGYNLEEHRIWTSDFPKKDMVASYDLDRSFGDLRWPVREQVIVDEKL